MEGAALAIAAHLAPGAVLVRTWPLTGGISAYVHGIELKHPDGRLERLVVRRHGALAKGHRPEVAADEHRLLTRLHSAGIAVAEPLWFDSDGEIFGTPCLVLRFVEGTTELPADAVVRMAAMLSTIHGLEVEALGLDFLPRRADPSDEGGPDLPARSSPAPHTALLHGDFWPGNLLWQDGAIAAVLDWEDAAIGDRLSDVAGCRQELAWALGEEAAEAFLHAYDPAARIDLRDRARWEVFVANAALDHMGQWGLPVEREAKMRRLSDAFLARAWRVLSR